MLNDRYPEFLAWLIGPYSRVVFDETHLGVHAERGVMTLARKYRLEGVLVSLVIVALLFLWKNGTSLVPKHGVVADDLLSPEEGKQASAGLVNLLHRSVQESEILNVCLEEWWRSHNRTAGNADNEYARARGVVERESILPSYQRNPVEAYRRICRVLKKKG